MVVNRCLLTSFFLLFFFSLGIAQQIEQQSLKKILTRLEQRFAVVFTYADDNIAGISLIPPPEKSDLAGTLHYLQRNTGLHFQQLNERFVTISKTPSEVMNICGLLIYADTGETVGGASIQCGETFSVSNEDGYFHLNVLKTDTLQVRFMGYKTLALPVSELLNDPCKKILLEPEFTTLQSVFVSDFITQGIDKKLDGAFFIHAGTLGMLPGLTEPDVLQTIQTLPGIQSINETISDINVRGGTNDQNLILWDGIRMYQSGHFFGLISAFNPYLTEKVTLVKNGSSADAGEGVSSTIDIRTDDQLSDNFAASAGMNMINADVLAKIPLSSKTSVHLSGRRSVSDLVRTPTYEQYFIRAFGDSDVTGSPDINSLADRNEKFRFYDTSLKWLYDITPKDKLRVSLLNVKNRIQFQENALVNNSNETRASTLEQQNLVSGIFYSRLWNETLRTSAQFYFSSYQLGAVNFDVPNDQLLIQENEVLDTGVKANARLNISRNVGLFTGYQFFETGIMNIDEINSPPFRRSIKRVLRSHAAFAEVDCTFGQTSMRAGIRSSYIPAFAKFIIEPRFALNQNFLHDFYLEILGEMKHQTTAQIIDLQSDFLGVEKRRWVLSNDGDIPIVRSRQVSAGIYYKKNDLLISADGYYKTVEGIITSSQGFQNQFQYVRASGNYRTVGLDFLISKKIDAFNTWLSYSNGKNTQEFSELIPPSFPGNLDIRHRATFGGSFQNKSFHVSAGLNWHTGKPYTEPDTTKQMLDNTINYQMPNSSRLDDYLRIDISGKYFFRIGKRVRAQVGASIWNLPNRENVVNRYFRINDNKQLESVQQPALGRATNVILRVTY